MKALLRRHIGDIEWLLGVAVLVISLAAWAPRALQESLTAYDVFPVFGLLAFGLMWTHFVVGALSRYAGATLRSNRAYKSVSMGLVLALLLLHPVLLWVGLFLDGYGVPPGSYMAVYGAQVWLLSLGTVALVIFLAYELRRKWDGRSWWRYIEHLQFIAMILIVIHAVGLGGELQVGWMQIIWAFYTLTLCASVFYSCLWDSKRKGK